MQWVLTWAFPSSQSPLLLYRLRFLNLVWWCSKHPEARYFSAFFLLIVLRMRGRTPGRRATSSGMLHLGTSGASGKWTPSMPLVWKWLHIEGPCQSVVITFKCKAESDSLKIPPGTIQTSVCPCWLALISTLWIWNRLDSGIQHTQILIN